MDEFRNSTSKIAIEIRTIAFCDVTFKSAKRINVSLAETLKFYYNNTYNWFISTYFALMVFFKKL